MRSLVKSVTLFFIVTISMCSPSYKIVSWRKTVLEEPENLDEISQTLLKFFSKENDTYSVSEFEVKKNSLRLMLADGSKSNHTKKMIMKISFSSPELNSNEERSVKYEIASC